MGRPNRIQFAGACYHIMLQGNNHRDIFMGNPDRRYFLSLLKSYKERYGLKVYAYCLMNDFVHLLIETAEPNLSKMMQGFNTAFTKYFNQQHATAGHVFQGRYKSLLVDKDKAPKWNPERLEDVPDAVVHSHFEAPPEGVLVLDLQ